MDVSVKTLDGKSAGKVALDDDIFGVDDIRADILHRTVLWQLAKRQAGTHSTKTRSEVARTTKKFGRQKGGGGARHGSRNAPIFVGGGVAHGPKPRSHAIKLPKKVRRMALAHALSSKLKSDALIVVDAAATDTPKTKDLTAKFEKLGVKNALVIGGVSLDENFERAARNIPNVDVLPVAGLNVYDILRRDHLVLSKDAIEGIKARFAGEVAASDDSFGNGDFVDDIQLIDGIGPKAAKALKAEGVDTLTAFVALDETARADVVEKAGVKADIADWVEQANEMIAGQPPRAKVDRDLAAKLLAKRAKGA